MTYCWLCEECEGITDVNRPSTDIDIPPESCSHCSSTSFSQRVIVRDNPAVKSYILSDSGYGWPSHGFYSQPYHPKK